MGHTWAASSSLSPPLPLALPLAIAIAKCTQCRFQCILNAQQPRPAVVYASHAASSSDSANHTDSFGFLFYLARRKINLSAVCIAGSLTHTHLHPHTHSYNSQLQLQQQQGVLHGAACGYNAATSCKMFAIFRQHQVAFPPLPPFPPLPLRVAYVIYELKPAIIWLFLIPNFAAIIWQPTAAAAASCNIFPSYTRRSCSFSF